jgi:Bacterial Ig-like domain (group 3)
LKKDGTKLIGTVALSVGVAAFTTVKQSMGTHPITAEYLGDADNTTRTSAVVDQVVP